MPCRVALFPLRIFLFLQFKDFGEWCLLNSRWEFIFPIQILFVSGEMPRLLSAVPKREGEREIEINVQSLQEVKHSRLEQ